MWQCTRLRVALQSYSRRRCLLLAVLVLGILLLVASPTLDLVRRGATIGGEHGGHAKRQSRASVLQPLQTRPPTPPPTPAPIPDWMPKVRRVVRGNQIVYMPEQERVDPSAPQRRPNNNGVAPRAIGTEDDNDHVNNAEMVTTVAPPSPLPAEVTNVAQSGGVAASPWRRERPGVGFTSIAGVVMFGGWGSLQPYALQTSTPEYGFIYTIWDAFAAAGGTAVAFVGSGLDQYARASICIFHTRVKEDEELDTMTFTDAEAAGSLLHASVSWQPVNAVRDHTDAHADVLFCALPSYFFTRGYEQAQTVYVSLRGDRGGGGSKRHPLLVPNVPIARLSFDRPTYRRYLSIWAPLLNQDRILVPWLEYHLMLGVEHFFLYDMGSTDSSVTLLVSYVRRGLVTVVDWSVSSTLYAGGDHAMAPGGREYQRSTAFYHALAKYGHTTEWLAALRVNEYLSGSAPKIGDIIRDAFDEGRQSRQFSALRLQTLIWGESEQGALDAVQRESPALLPSLMVRRERSVSSSERRLVLHANNLNLWQLHPWSPFASAALPDEVSALEVSDSRLRVNHYAYRTTRRRATATDRSLSIEIGDTLRALVAKEIRERSGANLAPIDAMDGQRHPALGGGDVLDPDDMYGSEESDEAFGGDGGDYDTSGGAGAARSADSGVDGTESDDEYEGDVEDSNVQNGKQFSVEETEARAHQASVDARSNSDGFGVGESVSVDEMRDRLRALNDRIMAKAVVIDDRALGSALRETRHTLVEKRLNDITESLRSKLVLRRGNNEVQVTFVSDSDAEWPLPLPATVEWVDVDVPPSFKSIEYNETDGEFDVKLELRHKDVKPLIQLRQIEGFGAGTRIHMNGTKRHDAVAAERMQRGYGTDYWTVWDVFPRRDASEVVVFADHHLEFRAEHHHFNCTVHVFDTERRRVLVIKAGALIGSINNAPESIIYCPIAKKARATLAAAMSAWPQFYGAGIQMPVQRTRAFLTLSGVYDDILLQNVPLIDYVHRASRDSYQYKLSAWTMVYNQETLIVPWIEFMLMMGVDHFFIYDNGCTDETIVRLIPYAKRQLVTVIEWHIDPWHKRDRVKPWSLVQMDAMNHFLKRFGDMTEWVAMMDVDEYVMPIADEATLRDVVEHYEPTCREHLCAGLRMRCRFFGGKRSKLLPQRLLMDEFRVRDATPLEQGYEKMVLRPAAVDVRVNIHSLIREPMLELPPEQIIFNHYWWDRPRTESFVDDSSVWQRYGAELEKRVPPYALRRSNL